LHVQKKAIQLPIPRISVRLIDDPTHPANGQRGVFADEFIPAFEIIGEYAGEYKVNFKFSIFTKLFSLKFSSFKISNYSV
jgi:hypothetical protein